MFVGVFRTCVSEYLYITYVYFWRVRNPFYFCFCNKAHLIFITPTINIEYKFFYFKCKINNNKNVPIYWNERLCLYSYRRSDSVAIQIKTVAYYPKLPLAHKSTRSFELIKCFQKFLLKPPRLYNWNSASC